jgi:hypothetical protein
MKPNKKTTHLHLQKAENHFHNDAIGQENCNDVFGFFIDIANGYDMIEPLAADPKIYTRLGETLAYLYSLFSKSVFHLRNGVIHHLLTPALFVWFVE